MAFTFFDWIAEEKDIYLGNTLPSTDSPRLLVDLETLTQNFVHGRKAHNSEKRKRKLITILLGIRAALALPSLLPFEQ